MPKRLIVDVVHVFSDGTTETKSSVLNQETGKVEFNYLAKEKELHSAFAVGLKNDKVFMRKIDLSSRVVLN